MTGSKHPGLAAVTTFADHEVIVVPNTLKKAVVRVKQEAGADPEDPLARAEAALADLSEEFAQWMDLECGRLDAARRRAKESGLSKQDCEDLFRAAHDIKGQAETFGFPAITPVAESLCRLIEHTPDPARIPFALIDQHVDGIRAIARRNTKGPVESMASRLATRLRQVTDEFLTYENRHRPEYLKDLMDLPPEPQDT
jgi:HPt (histidine-containing phosphotransfer) domain-containing protein